MPCSIRQQNFPVFIRANGEEGASNRFAEVLFIETEFPLEVGDDILADNPVSPVSSVLLIFRV